MRAALSHLLGDKPRPSESNFSKARRRPQKERPLSGGPLSLYGAETAPTRKNRLDQQITIRSGEMPLNQSITGGLKSGASDASQPEFG